MKRIKEPNTTYQVKPIDDDGQDEQEISFRRAVDAEGWAKIAHHLTLDNRISDGAYRTYALLLKYAQQKKKLHGGLARLAAERGLERPTISRHIKQLVDLGLITRERRYMQSSITHIEDLEPLYQKDDVTKLLPLSSRNSYDVGNENVTAEEEEVEEEVKEDSPNGADNARQYKKRIQSAVEKFYMADTTLTAAMVTHLGLTIRAKNKTHGEVMEFLHQIEATPADLQHFADYWRGVDWRGKQGQAPPPTCIIELWHAAKQWRNGVNKKVVVT